LVVPLDELDTADEDDDLLDDDEVVALELEVAAEAYKTRKLRATTVAMVLM
jgi:hypothetical protein